MTETKSETYYQSDPERFSKVPAAEAVWAATFAQSGRLSTGFRAAVAKDKLKGRAGLDKSEEKMAKALVFLAEGFEEIEAVTVVDVLRRADVEVDIAALSAKRVVGAHGLAIEADVLLDDIATGNEAEKYDAMILPGGMPGAKHLRDDGRVMSLVKQQDQSGRIVAAICAAPIALEAAGILRGKAATSYPGYALESADYREDRVVTDGHIVTSRGPGTALEFALILVGRLAGAEKVAKLRAGMVVA